jgi:hypothetical protein
VETQTIVITVKSDLDPSALLDMANEFVQWLKIEYGDEVEVDDDSACVWDVPVKVLPLDAWNAAAGGE